MVVAVVVACGQAALAGAVLSVAVECEQALVALACAQLALTGAVRLQAIASRELTSAARAGPTSVCLADLATGRAGVGVAEAGAAETGAGVEAGADGVGAPPR